MQNGKCALSGWDQRPRGALVRWESGFGRRTWGWCLRKRLLGIKWVSLRASYRGQCRSCKLHSSRSHRSRKLLRQSIRSWLPAWVGRSHRAAACTLWSASHSSPNRSSRGLWESRCTHWSSPQWSRWAHCSVQRPAAPPPPSQLVEFQRATT